MVCPTPRNGRLGFVGDYTGSSLTRYSRIRNWSITRTSNPQTRVYSGTRYGTQRTGGFTDITGSFEGFGGNPPLWVGDSFTFFGYTAPTSGVPCTEGYAYHCPAIVDSITINWDWTAENNGVTWSASFAANGALTEVDDFDDPCDDAVYCDYNPCDLTFVLKDPCNSDAVVEFCNIVSASLTFTSALDRFSNSSTNCQVQSAAGPIDWTLAVVDENPYNVLTLNADYWITILVSTTPTSWSLKWGKFVGESDLRVDTEAGAMIGKTNNFAMQAVNCCTPGSPVRGAIINPAGNTVWPYSTPA